MKRIILVLIFMGSIFGVQAQVMAGLPDPIRLCDFDNPGDEVEVFDLTIREPQIINGQQDVVVRYFETSGDAIGNVNAYPNPENFTNSFNPEIVFVRLQSTAGQGWDLTTLEIGVLVPVEVILQPENLFVDDGIEDGLAIFDLTLNESLVLGAQDPADYVFDYFISSEDALNNENAIPDPINYQNIANPQTIYMRFARPDSDCFEILDFEIETDGEILGANDAFLDSFVIYPNPVSEKLTIRISKVFEVLKISILDVNGRLLIAEENTSNLETMELDFSTLASGMYWLQLTSEENSIVKQIVKR